MFFEAGNPIAGTGGCMSTHLHRCLGFASLAGMNAAEVFGNATLLSASGSPADVAQAVQAGLREKTPPRQMTLRYVTPGTEERILEITVTSVHSLNGEILGAACLINDQTEVSQIRRQQTLRGETWGMASR